MGGEEGPVPLLHSTSRSSGKAVAALVGEGRSAGSSAATLGAAEGGEDRAVSTAEVKEALKVVRSLLASKKPRDMATARKVLGRVSQWLHNADLATFVHIQFYL